MPLAYHSNVKAHSMWPFEVSCELLEKIQMEAKPLLIQGGSSFVEIPC